MQDDTRTAVLNRLGRIEGQVRGIARMVEEERYCVDVMTQLAAARAALRKVEEAVLRDHVGHCVADALSSGDPAEGHRRIYELLDVLGRAGR